MYRNTVLLASSGSFTVYSFLTKNPINRSPEVLFNGRHMTEGLPSGNHTKFESRSKRSKRLKLESFGMISVGRLEYSVSRLVYSVGRLESEHCRNNICEKRIFQITHLHLLASYSLRILLE